MPDPSTLLKADHREAKQLLAVLAESDEGAERDELLGRLEAAVTLHMQLEEELLYPLVREHIGDEAAEEADVEHRLAREGLAMLKELAGQPGFGAAVEMLKGGLAHHIHEEESEILPELKGSVDRADWMAMGDEIVAAKERAGMPVPTDRRRPAARSATRRK